ncbi:MAG: TonB-dependent receptor [Vicinamibacterales bacterium]
MRRRLIAAALAIAGLFPSVAFAQGDGGFRGTVRDNQGGVLPGVTLTARSPEALAPGVAVTDENGTYRLVNLPPGTYTITAELPGFSTARREGVLLRAGATFQVDMEMEVGALEETITVTNDSPMIEIAAPSNVLNIDADFQKTVPAVASHFWSDFLQYTPGVLSRPHNDGSGRQNYFGNANEHRENVVMMEGMFAGAYNDFNINRTGLSTEAIEDTQVKTGGVDAGSPMGMSLVINMSAKSGGNQVRGSAGFDFQPLSWNGNNAPEGGSPSVHAVHQTDLSVGGPIRRDRTWFFSAFRWSEVTAGTGRSDLQKSSLAAFAPGQPLRNSLTRSNMPFVKVTSRLGANHTLVGVFQSDRLLQVNVTPISFQDDVLAVGGQLYGAKLNSAWGSHLTSTLTMSYNNKGGNNLADYDGILGSGPAVVYHQIANANQGILQGSGSLATGGNLQSMALDTSSLLMIRGDINAFKDGWIGSHEFGAGFLALPSSKYDTETRYLNDGFILEERRQINPNDPSAGTVPFHRRYVTSALNLPTASGRDHDIGLYAQDSWKPSGRLTANYGLRVDFVRRYDALRSLVRGQSVEVAPRFGFSYLVTEDAKNVLRASWGRYHRQLMGGRDPVASFGGSDAAAFLDVYDTAGDGSFSTQRITAARSAGVSAQQFDPNFHQPYTDELDLGFRRQFPWDTSVDIAYVNKQIKENYALVEINGFWPDSPGQPFGGFGRVDPNQGLLYRVTNADWTSTTYHAFQAVITKNMSHNFQLMSTIHKQWAHLNGTWNPTDPARFIQPDAFANNRNIWRTDGLVDQDSLATGATLINNPMWGPYSIRFAGTYNAPAGVIVSSTYTIVGGPWSGPLLNQLPANDPRLAAFGPATVVSSTGVSQPNPLATRIRFCGVPTGSPGAGVCQDPATVTNRGDGQLQQAAVHIVGLKLAKRIDFGARNLEVAFNVFNMFNGGNFSEFNRSGANRFYSPSTYGTGTTLQEARGYQVNAVVRF